MNRRDALLLAAASGVALTTPALAQAPAPGAAPQAAAQRPNNVIFFHPDGTGINHWTFLRYMDHGPDGETHWDRLPAMALYSGHLTDSLTGTSNAGAVIHATGVKVHATSFGLDQQGQPVRAASGQPLTIAEEAIRAGRAVALIQTGHIAEPGTAAFVAKTPRRGDTDEIARQVIESGARVIMSGGERMLLPRGVRGRHGEGARADQVNLIERAQALGYTIVYTREELAALNLANVNRLLGVFASNHTFNDQTEENLRQRNLPLYAPSAPTVAEMSRAALAIVSREANGFFMVVEEEGTDNFANRNNAKGQLEALRRSDAAIALFREHIAANPNTLMIMAADSEAGGLQIQGGTPNDEIIRAGQPLPERDRNGAPADGIDGTATPPWQAAADRNGNRMLFAITWGAEDDTSGNILVRADGLNANLVRGLMDNTAIYRVMYQTMFGRVIN